MEKSYLTKDKIIGKQVIDSNALIIGTVKDLSFDLVAKEIALKITTKNGEEVTVESEKVQAIGDVILLQKGALQPSEPEPEPTPVIVPPTEPPTEPPTPSTEPSAQEAKPVTGLCKECGYQNEQTNKFCIKCGSKL